MEAEIPGRQQPGLDAAHRADQHRLDVRRMLPAMAAAMARAGIRCPPVPPPAMRMVRVLTWPRGPVVRALGACAPRRAAFPAAARC